MMYDFRLNIVRKADSSCMRGGHIRENRAGNDFGTLCAYESVKGEK